jgi:hypothetical protein
MRKIARTATLTGLMAALVIVVLFFYLTFIPCAQPPISILTMFQGAECRDPASKH